MSRSLKLIKEYAEALFIALLLALFIRTFVVQAFKIPSGSMLQTLQVGDHLLVNKFIYGVKIPFTGQTLIPIDDPGFQDVIVFGFPGQPTGGGAGVFDEDNVQVRGGVGGKDFIKRIIGLPGDTIEVRDKQVYRNGKPLDEPYVQHTDPRVLPRRDNMGPVNVPDGHYFVMGDNRDESYDSRFWGFVPRENIKGEALFLYWSWGSEGPMDVRWNRLGDWVE
ncbi:signal peptidase I [Desulfohalovibrio reitneri]|uniref:signal peptidase I n=1 Tax=Desulfohalovibrio reitneri TaxID=1307759 RepID=UPI0004A6EB48|nr:signal peptidase I [Desulfohalovibrio reitneri]